MVEAILPFWELCNSHSMKIHRAPAANKSDFQLCLRGLLENCIDFSVHYCIQTVCFYLYI